jgi:flagellar biogenesis protein FliO
MREAGNSRTFTAAQALLFSLTALRVRLIALWERVARISRRPEKRLRLCESLPLGEQRFVAVVEFEKARFLLGGTATSLVLLSRLGEKTLRAAERGETSPAEINRAEINRIQINRSKKRENEPC